MSLASSNISSQSVIEKIPSLSFRRSSPKEENAKTCTEDASRIDNAEACAMKFPPGLTAINVEVSAFVRGIDEESKANIDACKSAGRTGKF